MLETANETITQLRRLLDERDNPFFEDDFAPADGHVTEDSISSFELNERLAMAELEEDESPSRHSVLLLGPGESSQSNVFKLSTLVMLGLAAVAFGLHK